MCPPGRVKLGANALGVEMVELLRTNDVVMLSWLTALLRDSGIEAVVLDTHMSVFEGSIGAIPRRVMVVSEDIDEARKLLDEAGIEYDKKAHAY